MAKPRVGRVPMAALMTILACSDAAAPSGVTLFDLAGGWRAIRYEFTSLSDSTHRVDLVAQGRSIDFEIDTDGRFVRIDVFPPGAPPATDAGTIEIVGSQLVITFDIDPDVEIRFAITLLDGQLTLSASEVEFDLGSGPEPSSLLIEFVRR